MDKAKIHTETIVEKLGDQRIGSPQTGKKNYRPFATKPWTLTVFLTAILTCIVLLEVASRRLPTTTDFQRVNRRDVSFEFVFSKRSLRINGVHQELDTSQHVSELTSSVRSQTVETVAVSTRPASASLVEQKRQYSPTSTTASIRTTKKPAPPASLLAITTSSPAAASPTIDRTLPPVNKSALLSSTTPIFTTQTPTSTWSAAYVSTSKPMYITSPTYGMYTAVSSFKFETDYSQYQATQTPSSTAAGRSNTQQSSPNADSNTSQNSKNSKRINFKRFHYFLAVYLPTLVAVTLSSIWSIIYSDLKMMEPFYQLSDPLISTGTNTMLAQYLSSGFDFDSIRSMLQGRWVMLLASLTYLAMMLVVPLVGESMTVQATAVCRTELSESQPCDPQWVIDVTVIRVLEILFSSVFLMVLGLILVSKNRASGIIGNPSSIASMAQYLGHQPFSNDLRSIDAFAKRKDIRKILHGHEYKLGYYHNVFGQERYGIVKTSPLSVATETTSSDGQRISSSSPYQKEVSKPLSTGFWRHVLMTLLVSGLLGVVVAYFCVSYDDPYNRFFTSEKFGCRFVLGGIAVIIGLGWKQIERNVRVMEPWRLMSRGPTAAEKTVLTTVAATAWSSIWISLKRRQWFVFFISATTILAQVLVIVIPGIPYSGALTQTAYVTSSYLCMAILGTMIIAIIATVIKQRRDPAIPRYPDNLIHVWLYLCNSTLLEHNQGQAGISDRDELRAKHSGMKYSFACTTNDDGKQRWMVH